jgi:hypothetical protein
MLKMLFKSLYGQTLHADIIKKVILTFIHLDVFTISFCIDKHVVAFLSFRLNDEVGLMLSLLVLASGRTLVELN